MSVVFKLTVIGINQDIAAVTRMENDINAIRTPTLDYASRTHQLNLTKFVHIWRPEIPKKGPHMIATIREERRGPNYVVVTVPTVYAQTENRRRGSKPGAGPHNFVDQAIKQTIPAVTKFWLEQVNGVMTRNKVNIVSL